MPCALRPDIDQAEWRQYPRQLQTQCRQTRWLYCVECPQYSIRLEELSYLCDCLSGLDLSTGIWHRRKFGAGFLYGVFRSGKWLWIDSNGKKWKLDFPKRDHLVINLRRSISLRSYGGLKSQDVEKNFIFLRVLLKTDPLRENFQNSVPKGFIVTPIDVLCSNFSEMWLTKSAKSCIQCTLESESNI